MNALKQKSRWPYRRLCSLAGVPYVSFLRWHGRVDRGEPAQRRPGPKPIGPFDTEWLRQRLQSLDHGSRRSRGTCALYREVHGQIPRRQFQMLVRMARLESHRQHAAGLRHVQWHVPGLVWGFDETEWIEPRSNGTAGLYLLPVSDMASRYRYQPLVSEEVRGEAIAAHLEALFVRHGAPLVLKRDNGSPLCHRAVDAVLARHWVIALNSPPHYPPYNGGIERAGREIKEWLTARVERGDGDRRLLIELGAHELNHQSRPCLQEGIACAVLASGRARCKLYTRRKRKEVYDAIEQLATAIWRRLGEDRRKNRDAIWRLAVETWLQREGVITITQNKKVLPSFLEKIVHN